MITVLGASGFIGSHLVKRLRSLGLEHWAPERNEALTQKNLGDVIYCIGLTSDFRSRPWDAAESHVCKLLEVLRNCQFDSLLYLSSTRLYGPHLREAREECALQCNPSQPDDLYNISKALGEALCLTLEGRGRVVRLSNVYGADFASDNFLPAIIRDALAGKVITLKTTTDSAKDYVGLDDVTDNLIRIATSGRQNLYNLASGTNTSNRQIMEKICLLTGCRMQVAPDAATMIYPTVCIDRMRSEFGFQPGQLLDNLERLVETFGQHGRPD